MGTAIHHIRRHVIAGLLAIVPIALTILLLRFLYTFIDVRITSAIEELTGIGFPGLGVLLLLVTLYVIGIAAENLIGRALLRAVESVTTRVPLIGRAYKVGKQLTETLSLPEKSVFRRAVLVEYLNPGAWTIGFVTNSVSDSADPGVTLLTVFVPTPPNPLSGTVVIVPESRIRDPGWSVEDALRAVISGGLIGPSTIG